MGERYSLRWTAWKVFIHPRHACVALDEALEVKMDLEKRLQETLDLLEEQRLEKVRISEEMTEMRHRLVAKERELESVRIELDRVRQELDEQESVDQKLEEFEKMLSGVESMKRGYEKRISTLEARLRDATAKLGRNDNYDLVDTIDMMAGVSCSNDNCIVWKPDVSDVLHDKAVPNDLHMSRSKSRKFNSERGGSAFPESLSKPGLPDDWLLSLPDDL